MRVAVFSTRSYDRLFLEPAFQHAGHQASWFEATLSSKTALLATGHDAVCVFVNDPLNASTIESLAGEGIRAIALRCAGANNVDLQAAAKHQMTVVRVPKYSPHAVAEHTLGLVLSLNRKIHKAYIRVRENNFSLDGLLGFDLHGRPVGVIGTGEIGRCVAKLFHGFGCHVLLHDPYPSAACEAYGRYTTLDQVLTDCDIVSLHCPLTDDTHHLINEDSLKRMRSHAMLVNTSRGGLVDTRAVLQALKQHRLGGVALDVYEEESELFFSDKSADIIADDVFERLLTFPNVLITAHQAFFTREALSAIAEVTANNLRRIEQNLPLENVVTAPRVMTAE